MNLEAIFYLVRGGIAWRQLRAEHPPPMTVYAVFARWVRGGAWQRMHDTLRDRTRTQEGRDRCPTAAVIDSQTVPAADTAPRSSRGWDGAKRTNGRKRHIAMDVNGLLLAVVVTATSIQDRDAAHRLLAALRVAFSTIGLGWADGGYPDDDVVFGSLIGLVGPLAPVCADELWECVSGFLRDLRRVELFSEPIQLRSPARGRCSRYTLPSIRPVIRL